MELKGWKQKSPKAWNGNGKNTIKVKTTKKGISVQLWTEQFGSESRKENTRGKALDAVKGFMNRRPQN